MFVPLRDLWWKYSCFDSETYGATINAAWAFCLLRLPVKSQSMRQEVGARQYQPMISWERKWVVLNVPKIQFMKSFWSARGNKGSRFIHWYLTQVPKCERQYQKNEKGWIVLCCVVRYSFFPLLHGIVHRLHFIVCWVLLYSNWFSLSLFVIKWLIDFGGSISFPSASLGSLEAIKYSL